MDTLAHGLWATAAAKTANLKLARKLRLRWAFWWGVFPDVFAFGPRFVLTAWYRSFTGAPVPWHSHVPLVAGSLPLFLRSSELYRLSHSLVILAAVFALVWAIRLRPAWVLLAWGLHILIDIPTHSLRFYPTPFLWPLSSYRFDGISWAQRWFMISNYSALGVVYLYFLLRRILSRKALKPAPQQQEQVPR